MMKKLLFPFCLILIFLLPSAVSGQQLTQTIRGVVIDEASGAPVGYASVALPEMTGWGTVADGEGNFVLSRVPLGRHTVYASLIGYEAATLREILLTSGKEVWLEIRLKEKVTGIEEVVIRPRVNKEEALNGMATTGARMLSIEEARRYAGGMDDPGRLVSAFAGVSGETSKNGISIHGNAPHLLQWRLEDVEIPNPNHFADLSVLGGGILSSLSSQVLGNSDFFTGAFPAEYGNALSGVFDMKMRNGNNHKMENTVQLGILGIDLASEGPFRKGGRSSYLFNYRYSTLGLLNLGESLKYQDLNFKLNFPTTKAGTFTVWGTGLIDRLGDEFKADPAKWEYTGDNHTYEGNQYMGAGGVSHRYFFNSRSSLKTTVAGTVFLNKLWQDSHDSDMAAAPYLNMFRRQTNLIVTSAYNHKFGAKHTNKTGFTYTRMLFDMDMDLAPHEGLPMQNISKGDGATDLVEVYTQSAINLTDRLTLNLGVNAQLLTLSDSWTLEPRVGMKWQAGKRTTLALAYGLHSRMEKMDVYFVREAGTGLDVGNKDLGFAKAHHFMFTYAYKLSDNLNLRIEPYYQRLTNLPVQPGTSFAVINQEDFYVEVPLRNQGAGHNYGVDVTLEKYLTDGLYYMATASLFNSEYKGGDGVWRNTRYNRNYIFNGLVGKEWAMGKEKKNTLSANLRFTYQGGERYSPVDEAATLADPDKMVHYDETRAFSKRYPDMFTLHMSVSYRINRPKTAHEFAVQMMNLNRAKEYYGHDYNFITGKIVENTGVTAIPNISYRIHF